MPKRSSEKLQEWISRNPNYVAHAIWPKNVAPVIQEGRLVPAEARVRQKKVVEYEAGGRFADRRELSIEDILKRYGDKPIPSRLSKNGNRMSPKKAMEYHFITDDAYNDIINGRCESILLKDGKIHKIDCEISSSGKKKFYIQDIPTLMSNKEGYAERRVDGFTAEIAKDVLLGSEVDHNLASVWQIYQSLCIGSDYRAITRDITEIRHSFISPTKLNKSIRASYNSVWWSYGDVAVLRGNPEPLLSATNFSNTDADLECKFEDLHYIPGREVCLLDPFENNGDFFSLDLCNANILLMGPKAILEEHLEILEHKGIHYLYFEDMSQEQLAFFSVPKKFHKQALLVNQEENCQTQVNERDTALTDYQQPLNFSGSKAHFFAEKKVPTPTKEAEINKPK